MKINIIDVVIDKVVTTMNGFGVTITTACMAMVLNIGHDIRYNICGSSTALLILKVLLIYIIICSV